MQRQVFPSDVRVAADDLQRVESARSTEILERFVDSATLGIVSGLRISLNALAYRLDVSAGSAYVPNGERVDVPTAQLAIALADYTDAVLNYVALTYTEASGSARGTTSGAVARETRVTPSFRLRVLTAAEYAALPATSTDMTTEALDRTVILGTILGNGFTGTTPNNLVAGEIVQAAAIAATVLAASPASSPPNMVGARITGVGSTNPVGNGTLTKQVGPLRLQWTSPAGGDTAGAAVDVSAGGTFTLTSTAGHTLTVLVEPRLLTPTGTETDTIVVSTLYETATAGQHFSVQDRAHRNTRGTGAPTTGDPHGSLPVDHGPSFLPIPQLVSVGSNHIGTAAQALLARLLLFGSSAGGAINTFLHAVGPTVPFRYLTIGTAHWFVFNASYNGTNWSRDAADTAFAIRWTTTAGLQFCWHDFSEAGTWANTISAVSSTNWELIAELGDDLSVYPASAFGALTTGSIGVTGNVTASGYVEVNDAPVASPQPHRLYDGNLPKNWAHIITLGDSAFGINNVRTFGCTVEITATTTLRMNFDFPMEDADSYEAGGNVETLPYYINPGTRNQNWVEFHVRDSGGALVNVDVAPVRMSLHANGFQA